MWIGIGIGVVAILLAGWLLWQLNKPSRDRAVGQALKELGATTAQPLGHEEPADFPHLTLPDRPMKNRALNRKVRDERRHRPAPMHPINRIKEQFDELMSNGQEDQAYLLAWNMMNKMPTLLGRVRKLPDAPRLALAAMAGFVVERLVSDRDVATLAAARELVVRYPALDFLTGSMDRAYDDHKLMERIIGIIKESPGLAAREISLRLNLDATRVVPALDNLARWDWVGREKQPDGYRFYLARRWVEEQEYRYGTPPLKRHSQLLQHPSPFPDQNPHPT